MNLSQPSVKILIEWSILLIITGLIALSSKLPWLPEIPIVISLPITWIAIITIASHWVGLTFPGIIELPGSFAGKISSPKPQFGPLASHLMSLAIFISATAKPFSVEWTLTRASKESWAVNLFWAVTNGLFVSSTIFLATSKEKPFGALSPVSTAVPPIANSYRSLFVLWMSFKHAFNCPAPPWPLLSHWKWNSVF